MQINLVKKIDRMWNKRPIDDKNYLVCYKRAEGDYSAPHRAYWIEEERHFFSLENNNSHPIIADIWIEIPEHPQCFQEQNINSMQ